MTTSDASTTPFAELAAEPPETSVEQEVRAVGGDQPDEGGTVPQDLSQAAGEG